jgi:hypothetical protein
MRTLTRIACAGLLALIASLGVASAAPAAKKNKKQRTAASWAKSHDLKGNWRQRDKDGDGLNNLAEFKAKTDPKRKDTDRDKLRDGAEVELGLDPLDADSDNDGTRDGAEKAGSVVAFANGQLTLKLVRGGRVTAAVTEETELDCDAADDDGADDFGDDEGSDGFDDATLEDDAAATETVPGEVIVEDTADDPFGEEVDEGDDAAADEAGVCDSLLKPGTLVREAEVERIDGVPTFVEIEFAE